MKSQTRTVSLFLLLAAFVILGRGAAMAGISTVYNNGPYNNVDAWTINSGYWVEDSFVLSAPSNLTHVDFAVSLIAGDTLTSVQWTIYAAGPSVGRRPVKYTGTATTISEGCDFYNDCEEGFALPNLNLPAGTYYLRLENAVTNPPGDPAFWGESGGPSTAFESSLVGTIPSESFDIVDPPPGEAAPASRSDSNPGTLTLLGSGALGLGAVLRRLVSL